MSRTAKAGLGACALLALVSALFALPMLQPQTDDSGGEDALAARGMIVLNGTQVAARGMIVLNGTEVAARGMIVLNGTEMAARGMIVLNGAPEAGESISRAA